MDHGVHPATSQEVDIISVYPTNGVGNTVDASRENRRRSTKDQGVKS